jgi:hypothetical protein
MKLAILFFLLSVPALAQLPSSICSKPVDPEALLTICNDEHGMASLMQPQLYMRVYADGRAEYEKEVKSKGTESGWALKINKLKLRPEDINEIRRLAGSADFKAAKPDYRAYELRNDSSLHTTITYRDEPHSDATETAKTIKVTNYRTGLRPEAAAHYPSSFNALMEIIAKVRQQTISMVVPAQTITFCELVKNAAAYIGKNIQTDAVLEHWVSTTADGKRSTTTDFLHDPECTGTAEADFRLPVIFGLETLDLGLETPQSLDMRSEAPEALETRNSKPETPERPELEITNSNPETPPESLDLRLAPNSPAITEAPFYGTAHVWVTGTIRHAGKSTADLAFEIKELTSPPQPAPDWMPTSFTNLWARPFIETYKGTLKNGHTYHDTFTNSGNTEIKLSSPLRPGTLDHGHGSYIQWSNKYAIPTGPAGSNIDIVFRITSILTEPIAPKTWRTIYSAEILQLK